MLAATEKKIAGMFVGVSDEAFQAAAARRAGAIISTQGDQYQETRDGRRNALDMFPGALGRISAADEDDSESAEDLIEQAEHHLAARTDPGQDDDARLASACRCLMRALEMRCNSDASSHAAVTGFVMRSVPVRFAPLPKA